MGKAAVTRLLAAAASLSLFALAPAATASGPATPAQSASGPATPAQSGSGPATPAQSAAVPPAPPLTAKAAILTVLDTGQRLYGLNANQQLPIASATKLMTALQTLEHASLTQTFTDPNWQPAPGDSQIGLVPGEHMSVRDLMVGMLVPSGDDAAQALAYNVGGGSVQRFVAMMNQGARALGLSHTHYSTPIGFDTPGNYSSAADLVKLAAYLLHRYPFFAHVVGLAHATLTTGNYPRYVVARNALVGQVPWIHGVKTGHTQNAGYVLVADGTRNGMTLVSAVLGTPSEAARDQSTLALLDWGFANFRLAHPLRRGSIVGRPTVNGDQGRRVDVVAARTVAWAIPRSARLRVRLKIPHNLDGPLRRASRVGTATVLDGATIVEREPLLLARAIPGLSWLTRLARFITEPTTLVVLIALLAAAAALTIRRRRASSPA